VLIDTHILPPRSGYLNPKRSGIIARPKITPHASYQSRPGQKWKNTQFAVKITAMPIKLYNFLSRRLETFRPLRDKKVGFYTCGPTVYNYAHLGNLRTYIFEDILERTLEWSGYRVKRVMNITDVEDKIIRESKKAGKSIFEFTKPYLKAFFEDIKKLNLRPADVYPKATRHIQEMIALINKLLKKGLAYRAGDSVYFDISKFKNYGRLSRLKLQKLKAGARIDVDEYTKEAAEDFVLWKGAKPGEPSWPASFGRGRPGWHIECSAMSMKYLGATFDIHAGGVDLIFPHHENEIAQAQGATGKKFARYFIEGEHLLVEGQKMAKSLGNTYTLRDIETRNINPLAFRYLVLGAHYRQKLNFTWDSLKAAERGLKNLYHRYAELKKNSSRAEMRLQRIRAWREKFAAALYNDLNTPAALAVTAGVLQDQDLTPKEKITLLADFDQVLGLEIADSAAKILKIPPKIKALVEKREKFRRNKQFVQADRLRQEIERLGYRVDDTPRGPRIRKS
jgi:cysteinyl-tRNA synthetase